MGKRGPAPKPTNLRVLHGDRKDRINTNEPQPARVPVSPPDGLSEDAAAVWGALAPDLERAGLLLLWDVTEFATYCDAEARHRRAAEALDREGEVVASPVFNKNGEVTGERLGKNPWMLVWESTAALKSRIAAKYALTPSDRSQFSLPEGESGDDLLTG